jgi:hypothetical protein
MAKKVLEVAEIKDDAVKALQKHSDKQFFELQEAKKLIEVLRAEITELKEQQPTQMPMIQQDSGVKDEKVICLTQLYLLKEKATQRELSFEEARKVQIYTDILEKLNKNVKSEEEVTVQALSEEELLKMVGG